MISGAYLSQFDISDYFELLEDELTGILNGFGYPGIEDVKKEYGSEANQVMAECVFEHYGSFQANKRFEGSMNDCESFIKHYIAENN